jgi:hypothetical protein
MKRAEALASIGLASAAALAACTRSYAGGSIPSAAGSPLHPTAFGAQIYPSDDIARTIALLAACGSTLIRVTASDDFAHFDALFAAASARGIRVIAISDYAPQPVDLAAYAAKAVAFQQRYAAFAPIWELWNEPNLATYWGAPPDVRAYAALAISTATALRGAGAREILSGGISGVDAAWIYNLRVRGVFDACTGCGVHSYDPPARAQSAYLQAVTLLPPGVRIYTTEACVSSYFDQTSFFRGMWDVHRELSLPAMVWCEFRDGTAGPQPPYTDPYGLVSADYAPKPVYAAVQATIVDR